MYLVVVSFVDYEKVNFNVIYTWYQESERLQLCIVKSNLWSSYLVYSAFKETPYRRMNRDAAAASLLKENVFSLPLYNPPLQCFLTSFLY